MTSSLSLAEIHELENRLKAKQTEKKYPLPPVEPVPGKRQKKEKWGEMTSTGEGVSLDDIRALANQLKQRRILWGMTQGQLGELICYKYGARLSQTTVSRFEMMDCTLTTAKRLYRPMKEMLELIDEIYESDGPRLSQGLCEAVRERIGGVAPTMRERKRRVTYTDEQLNTLDALFHKCESPTSTQLNRFAVSLGLGFSEVRVWFCNRRQKRRRTMTSKNGGANMMGTLNSNQDNIEDQANVPSCQKSTTVRVHLRTQGVHNGGLSPIIESLDRMPKEEIVINVSQKA